jgi:hypothetical protein
MYSSEPEFEVGEPWFDAAEAAIAVGADAYLSATTTLEEMVAFLHAGLGASRREWVLEDELASIS